MDRGKTFVESRWLEQFTVTGSIHVFRGLDGSLYVLTFNEAAPTFSYSDDNGEAWQTHDRPLHGDFAVNPDGVVHALVSEGNRSIYSLHRSDDRGASWIPTGSFTYPEDQDGVPSIVAPAPGVVILVGASYSETPTLYVSYDDGQSFDAQIPYEGTGTYLQFVYANRRGDLFMATEVEDRRGVEIRRSTDLGRTWELMAHLDFGSQPELVWTMTEM